MNLKKKNRHHLSVFLRRMSTINFPFNSLHVSVIEMLSMPWQRFSIKCHIEGDSCARSLVEWDKRERSDKGKKGSAGEGIMTCGWT